MSEPLRETVFAALERATENETDFAEFAKFAGGQAYQIAIDLGTYCPDLEGSEPEALKPHVEAWLKERGDALREMGLL